MTSSRSQRPPRRPRQHADVGRRVEQQFERRNVLAHGPVAALAGVNADQFQPAADSQVLHRLVSALQARHKSPHPVLHFQHLLGLVRRTLTSMPSARTRVAS